MKGRFIVLEGIDGCGKTTQIKHLANWLPHSGLMPKESILHITREPGGTELGLGLRELLLNVSTKESPEPLTELILYAADRAQHISKKILPAIKKGDWVLSDRFSGSTIAYQGFGRKLNIEIIKQLEKIAVQDVYPDLTIWLDITIEQSIKRRLNNSNDRIEAEGKEFLENVADGFSLLAKDRSWIKVCADNNQKDISIVIEKEIRKYFTKEFK
tara:strand:- start:1694 stop:2335 length:642 start_codon:yes stop_codon:yes gene_type:complete